MFNREKLNALSKTLARVKTEKSRQIDDLEQGVCVCVCVC